MSTHKWRTSALPARQNHPPKLQLVDSQVLMALRMKPHTLYSLSRSNVEIFGRAIMSTGILHPHLVKLERLGFIRGYAANDNRRRKRVYKVTSKGLAELGRQVKLFNETLTKLKGR
jgi:DNA-binding PadR family transcriptional regulator